MRIGIDISSVTPQRTGIGNYTYELVRRVVREQSHDFVLLFNSLRQPVPEFPELHLPNVTLRHYRIPGPLLLRLWQWADVPHIEALIGRVDLFHSPATYVPPQRHGARLTTVHDLYFRHALEQTDSLGGRYLNWIVEHRLAEMDAVITPAHSTGSELVETLGGQERWALADSQGALGRKRIHVVPLGVDERFFEAPEAKLLQETRRAYQLPERYILHVGTQEPRKNLPCLLEAYALLCREMSDAPLLVLAGGEAAWGEKPLGRMVEELGIASRVSCTGYVHHEHLPSLYRMAELFVLPSRMEGFGLPVLEAMASRTAVVCTATVRALEFTPEGAARRVDADDAQALGGAMQKLLESPERRQAQVEAAFEAVGALSWHSCAQKTLRIYEQTVEGLS